MRTGLRGACPCCFLPIGWEQLSHEGIIHGRNESMGGPYFTIRCSTCQTDLKAVGGRQRVYSFFELRERRVATRWERILRALFGKPAEQRENREEDERGPDSEEQPAPPNGRIRRHQHRLRVLGLSADVSLEEIKNSYRQMVKECHPDLHHQKSEAERLLAERRFVEITCAYQELVEHW